MVLLFYCFGGPAISGITYFTAQWNLTGALCGLLSPSENICRNCSECEGLVELCNFRGPTFERYSPHCATPWVHGQHFSCSCVSCRNFPPVANKIRRGFSQIIGLKQKQRFGTFHLMISISPEVTVFTSAQVKTIKWKVPLNEFYFPPDPIIYVHPGENH